MRPCYTIDKKQTKLFQYGFSRWSINKMVNIKESANNYVDKSIKNISELKSVSVDSDIKQETFTKEDGETFTISYIEVNEEKFRIPDMVLKQLKVMLEDDKSLEQFKVLKSGSGLATSYQVVKV